MTKLGDRCVRTTNIHTVSRAQRRVLFNELLPIQKAVVRSAIPIDFSSFSTLRHGHGQILHSDVEAFGSLRHSRLSENHDSSSRGIVSI